ncbi:MAG: PAS domain S-box protein [Alphaproteobacteria bacterium]|nr:PAS domain S-box protein [Alphaproteobacteria bacterium]
MSRTMRPDTDLMTGPQLVTERQLRLMLDAIPARIWFMDHDHRVRYANRECGLLFGVAPEKLVGKTAAELLGDENFLKDKASRERALTGETVRWEGWMVYSDGTERYTQRVFTPHISRAGEIDGYYEFVRDVTSLKIAEREQQRLAQLLRDAVDSLTNGFAVFDADARLGLCNTAYAELYGFAPDELIGLSDPELREMFRVKLKTVAGRPVPATEDALAAELRHHWRDREPVEVELLDGRWLLLSRQSTADGGFVFLRTDITDRKQAEQEQQRLSQLLQDALASIPNGFVVFDKDGNVAICNAPYAALYDKAPEEMVGITLEELSNASAELIRSIDGRRVSGPDDWKSFILGRYKAGIVKPFEIEIDDGRWFMLSIHPTSDGGRVGIRTDITEIKQAEKQLKESEALKAAIISSSLDCIVTADETGTIIEFNPAAERVFGYHRKDVIGRNVKDVIVPPHLRKQHEEGMRRYLETGEMRLMGSRFEIEGMRSDGSVFPLEAALSEVHLEDGRAFATYLRDISARVTMERELRRSEQRFRSMAEVHPVPVAIPRMSDGKMLYVSKPWSDLFRISREDAIGRSSESFYANPADRARFLEILERDGVVNDFEVEVRKADGTMFWVSLTSRRIVFDGQDAIITGLFDLTERRAAAEQIQRQREALHQSEKLSALGSLLAGIAHELNNPLAVVVGQSLMLSEDTEDPAIAERAEKIKNAAERCARIVKTFLDMARQREPQRRLLNVNELIGNILELLGNSLKTSGVEFSHDLAPDLPLLQADPDQLHQLLTNLILNAQQALSDQPRPRRLIVRTERNVARDSIRIAVVDNGPGVPRDIRSRIFEPLYTKKPVGKGTGIGLSVCQAIAESHEGTILVEDTPGGGATFVVTLPVATCGAEVETVAPRRVPTADTPRVLVVEDEEDVAAMLLEILNKEGYDARVAGGAREAIQELKANDFDIVISDVRMVDVDGRALYRWVKAARPGLIPCFIFLTGDTLSPGISDFLAKTGRPVLEKPVLPEELCRVVDATLAGRRETS